MRYIETHSKSHTRRTALSAVLMLLCLVMQAGVWESVPDAPNPPRLVNDLAGIIQNKDSMERVLVALADSTAKKPKGQVQVVVLTVNDLDGYNRAEYAYTVGDKWGVGGKEFDNGVVILVKPKTADSKGEVFIATGRGIEGALPDGRCSDIIQKQMIPLFKQDKYEEAIWAAVNTIIPIARDEFQNNELYEDDAEDSVVGLLCSLIVMGLIIWWVVRFIMSVGSGGGGGGYSGGSSSGTWGGVSSGGWSSSSSSSSSGGGGFGGFGGGSFGGGGAGGSW